MKLDYGCGNGGFMELLDNRIDRGSWLDFNGGIDAVGIDHRKDYILSAKKRINNGTEFVIADGKYLPFKSSIFDSIHSNGVMHHIENHCYALNEITRVSKSGADIYIMESVSNDPFFAIFRKMLNIWQGDTVESFFTSSELLFNMSWNYDILEKRYYWRSTIGDILAYFNLESDISLKFNNFVTFVLRKIHLDKLFCSHFIVVMVRK